MKSLFRAVTAAALLCSGAFANPLVPRWALIDTTAPARYDFAAAYSALDSSIVLFGGIDTSGEMPADTWKWNGTNWQQVATTGPVGRSGFGMSYMEGPGLILLYGGWSDVDGYLGDTWIWDGISWTQVEVVGPPARSDFAMAYNQGSQSIILFGGANGQMVFGDTWEWDGIQWSLVDTTGPDPRIYSKMTSDPNYSACLLFGGLAGYNGETLGDFWAWVGNEWIQLPDENPSPRMGHMMAYNPAWDLSVELFGGQDGPTPFQYYDDTWLLDRYMAWYLVDTGEPPARSFGEMVYAAGIQKVVVIGGSDSTQVFHDMWAYPVFDSPCDYIPGDVNQRGGFTGLDVVYAVAFLKGGPVPPFTCECPSGSGHTWYVAGDVNGSCTFSGTDVLYMVNYFKGGPDIQPCPACPPGR